MTNNHLMTLSRMNPVILGAVFDFMLHLMSRPQPLVIGGNYPRDKVTVEFEAWAKERGLDITDINRDAFIKTCQ